MALVVIQKGHLTILLAGQVVLVVAEDTAVAAVPETHPRHLQHKVIMEAVVLSRQAVAGVEVVAQAQPVLMEQVQ